MKIKVFLFGIAFALVSNFAWAGCSFTNVTEVRSLTNSFDAWKAVTEAMSECGNVTATLDSEFKDILICDEQEKKYPKLSKTIGWNSIQRRNIGFIEAYNLGADIVATVDDDNIPYDEWGDNVIVGQTAEIDFYNSDLGVCDPLSVTDNKEVWHRGYPIDMVPYRHRVSYGGKLKRKVLIQADLWDGDPDIDAVCRLQFKPMCFFDNKYFPISTNVFSPFNSQNTVFSKKALQKAGWTIKDLDLRNQRLLTLRNLLFNGLKDNKIIELKEYMDTQLAAKVLLGE